ncbi:MAG: hypothetical protein ACRECF_03155 [Methyloceanibacter sp.]
MNAGKPLFSFLFVDLDPQGREPETAENDRQLGHQLGQRRVVDRGAEWVNVSATVV